MIIGAAKQTGIFSSPSDVEPVMSMINENGILFSYRRFVKSCDIQRRQQVYFLRSKLGQISVVIISGFNDSIGIVENHGIIKGVILDNYY